MILAIGGVKVTGVPACLKKIEGARAGDVLTVEMVRDGVKAEKQVMLNAVKTNNSKQRCRHHS